MFFLHLDAICDLLLNRDMAAWNYLFYNERLLNVTYVSVL